MIISASRRTDLPAFHVDWFMQGIRAQFCEVANPYNPHQRNRISLDPGQVTAIVFWTRNAERLLPHLQELDSRGHHYLFLYTLVDYPPLLEPRAPDLAARLDTFKRLSDRVGPDRIAWRYDPIVLSSHTDHRFHMETFYHLAAELAGFTERVIVSLMDVYAKVRRRLAKLPASFYLVDPASDQKALAGMMRSLVATAEKYRLTINSCAEKIDLRPYGITPGACIDAESIEHLVETQVSRRKDPGQRKNCRCLISRDIGAYDTCQAGCVYCYAAK